MTPELPALLEAGPPPAAEPAAAAPPAALPWFADPGLFKAQERHPFSFHGRWTDYWRIWIVNLALSILTLGIYSAWAKVRSKRWFYGQTELAGSRFAYHGQPIPILKGRLVAAALAIGWLISMQLGPGWIAAALLLFVLLLPWLLVRAAAFRARNSSWRGLRFGFDGRTGAAFARYALPLFGFVLVMGLMGFVIGASGFRNPLVATLMMLAPVGLAYPFVAAMQRRYMVDHHRFGSTGFRFFGDGGTLFTIYFLTGLLFIPLNLLAKPLDMMLEGAAQALYRTLESRGLDWLAEHFAVVGPLLLAPLILIASLPALFGLGYLRGRSMRWQWSDTRLGEGVRFECNLNPWSLAVAYLVNGLAIALSLGLLVPWAMVRTARLRADAMVLVSGAPLDGFVAAQGQDGGAAGDEVGDLVGLDVGL